MDAAHTDIIIVSEMGRGDNICAKYSSTLFLLLKLSYISCVATTGTTVVAPNAS